MCLVLPPGGPIFSSLRPPRLDFCSHAFCSNYTPRCSLTAEGAKAVDSEIKLLLLKRVISPELKADSFVSSIFTTMKPTILNLKNLNESIIYVHF